MPNGEQLGTKLGWVGTGRMGYSLARRLLDAGHDVAVCNRTRAKAEPLEELGARIVDDPRDLADREVVFTIVAGSADFVEVVTGPRGVLGRSDAAPEIIVDITTVAPHASAEVRERAEKRGAALLAAPISGNPRVVDAGLATMAVSGPAAAYSEVEPILSVLSKASTYVGEGELARLAKICHNLLLGVVTQNLAEITVLAEKGGIARADLLQFINESVMGSMFTRYKTPAFVALDYSPTFTPTLLRKDFDLGFRAADDLGVPMPVAAAAREMIQALIGQGRHEEDFAALLDLEAAAAGLDLEPEEAVVGDGIFGARELPVATRADDEQ